MGYLQITRWRFPKIEVPPNHPFIDGIFHEINHPAIGYPHDYGNPHITIDCPLYIDIFHQLTSINYGFYQKPPDYHHSTKHPYNPYNDPHSNFDDDVKIILIMGYLRITRWRFQWNRPSIFLGTSIDGNPQIVSQNLPNLSQLFQYGDLGDGLLLF